MFGGVFLRKVVGAFDDVDLMLREHASEALVPPDFIACVCVYEHDKRRQSSEFVRLVFELYQLIVCRRNTSDKISLVMAPRTFLEWFEVGAPGGPRKLSLFDVCGWVWRYKRVS